MTPARLIMSVFFIQAVGLANFFPRIPDLQARFGVETGELSLGLLGSTVATLFALPFAGPIIERFGPRRVLMVCLALYMVALAGLGWVQNVPMLFAALFLVGLPYPIVDVAMNVEADREERVLGRRIMSTCHGWWSLGAVAGGLTAAAFAALNVDPGWHLMIVAALALPVGILVTRSLPERAAAPTEAVRRRVFTLPSLGILGLCLFLFGSLMIEVTARNWSGIFVREVTGGAPAFAGITYGAFALFMAGGRLAGDRLVDRFGPVALARICYAVILAGITLVVFAATPAMVVAGFAAAGFGVSVAFPLSVTAAVARGDQPAAVNIAALQLVGITAFLSGPPLIGYIAEATSLRVGLAILLPVIAVSAFMARELAPTPNVAPLARQAA
ncbi:MFS transporter [soil metagenome]